MPAWESGVDGVITFPSGRRVRGRGLRNGPPVGELPEHSLILLGKTPSAVPWSHTWLKWHDFWLPSNSEAARVAFVEVLERSAQERVEVACYGGKGRTGTALACIAILDGVPPEDAVAYVRDRYDRHAAETPWQCRYVRQFSRA